MFATLLAVAAFALGVFADEVSINTPKSVSTCKEVVITWQGGKAPYTVSVVPGDDPCDDALVVLPTTNNTWFKWQNPQLSAGTKIIFAIEDGTQDEAWSNELTIQTGSTTSCASSNSSSTDASQGTATTLVVPASATQTVPASSSNNGDNNTGDTPVANAQGALGGAPALKGGYAALGTGLLVAFGSAFLAL